MKYNNILAEMARKEITQADLARELNLPQSGISNRLNGKVEWSKSEIDKVCDLLGMTYEELFK